MALVMGRNRVFHTAPSMISEPSAPKNREVCGCLPPVVDNSLSPAAGLSITFNSASKPEEVW